MIAAMIDTANTAWTRAGLTLYVASCCWIPANDVVAQVAAITQSVSNGDVPRVMGFGHGKTPYVTISIMRKGSHPVPRGAIQDVRIVSGDDKEIGFRIRPDGNYSGPCMGGWCSYTVQYELALPADFQRLGSATFTYRGQRYAFDLTDAAGDR